ncbi:hypothetical protein LCGC14_1519340 [marine sediment metagenome]|uniref:Uncharacterized protein n=1 Tax=marine sediment metagenome TaxID=412755 RepID=A0A0F9IZ47_9ZZZZ
MIMTTEAACDRLLEILRTMNVAELKTHELNIANLSWMNRFLHYKNKKHPQLSEARKLIKKLIKATRNESWEI